MSIFISHNPSDSAMGFIGAIKPSLSFQLYRLNVRKTKRKPKQTEERLS